MPLNNTELRAIPWSHEAGEIGAVWQWETPHFQVIVNGNVRSCYYRISDKSTGSLKPFADGQAGTFEDTEMLIRETIGKAYPPHLGYQPFAGYLAATFQVATGGKKDFSQYIGKAVTITVLQPDGSRHNYEGILQVSHYNIEIHTDKIHLKVLPSYIEKIETQVERKTVDRSGRIMGRLYKGKLIPGCNGIPGFKEDTVDHHGIPCPMHES